MRRTLIALVTLGGLSFPAVADEWQKILFFAATNDTDAQILNTETGQLQRLLTGKQGQPPEKCPPKAYWAPTADMANVDRLISCDDGKAYDLMRAEVSGLKGAYALVPRPPTPDDETPEPGPRMKDMIAPKAQ